MLGMILKSFYYIQAIKYFGKAMEDKRKQLL